LISQSARVLANHNPSTAAPCDSYYSIPYALPWNLPQRIAGLLPSSCIRETREGSTRTGDSRKTVGNCSASLPRVRRGIPASTAKHAERRASNALWPRQNSAVGKDVDHSRQFGPLQNEIMSFVRFNSTISSPEP